MLTATKNDNEVIWQGQVEIGDLYPSYCCPGFDWEVLIIFPDKNPNYISIWGGCHNPNCPDWDGTPDDHYRGVSSILQEDLAERLAEGTSRHRVNQ